MMAMFAAQAPVMRNMSIRTLDLACGTQEHRKPTRVETIIFLTHYTC